MKTPDARVSIVTTCKGREDALERTLPYNAESLAAYCGHAYLGEIIVVDFDSPGRYQLASICRDVAGPLRRAGRVSLKLVRVAREPYWRSGLAKNIGIRYAGGEYIACVDADIGLSPEWFEAACDAVRKRCVATCNGPNDAMGTMMFPRELLLASRGYEEAWPVKTWCQDDLEIRERWSAMGWGVIFCGAPSVVVEHDDAARFKYGELRGDSRQAAIERSRHWMETLLKIRRPSTTNLGLVLAANQAVGADEWGKAEVVGVEVLS